MIYKKFDNEIVLPDIIIINMSFFNYKRKNNNTPIHFNNREQNENEVVLPEYFSFNCWNEKYSLA